MTAHGRKLQRLAVRHTIGLPEETQRILDAVALQTRPAGALLSFVEGGTDVDRQSQICFLQLFDEGHN